MAPGIGWRGVVNNATSHHKLQQLAYAYFEHEPRRRSAATPRAAGHREVPPHHHRLRMRGDPSRMIHKTYKLTRR